MLETKKELNKFLRKREWDKVYAKSIYLYAQELYENTEDPTAVLLLSQIMELAECISEGDKLPT
jgi:hypothetical protein